MEETAQATPKLPHEGLPVLWTIKGKDGTVTVFDTSSVEMPRLLTRAEKLRALIEAVRMAPSASNTQPWK